MRSRILAAAMVAAALVSGPGATAASAGDQTASQFYMEYRAAFDKAKSVEDLMPYMAKATVEQMKATPEEERTMMFEMVKEMGALTDVKIVKETKSDTGATLDVDAVGPDKAKTKGTITIVKEDGAWKIAKESWSSGP